MQVAITDYTFPSLEIEQGILAPHDVVAGQCKSGAGLADLVREADAVITQFAPVTREVIGAMRKSRVIVRYGIGVDNVDLEAAREREFRSATCPTTASTRWPTTRWRSSWRRRGSVVANCQGVRGGKLEARSAAGANEDAPRSYRGHRGLGTHRPRSRQPACVPSNAAGWCSIPPSMRRPAAALGCEAVSLEQLLSRVRRDHVALPLHRRRPAA